MAATIRIIVTTEGGVEKVSAQIGDLGETAKKSGGGFNALQEMATGAFRAIGAAAVNLAGQGLAAIGGFLKDSIGVAGDFQSKMNEVGAALGKGFEPGTAALDQFKDLFISLGKELPVSTAEVQDAALALIKGGLDPAVVQAGALKDSLNFAAAAGMDLADAAELTIKQLGTFVPIGASVEEQTRFMADAQNLLVKAAGASTLDVDKLGDAMLAAGGAAKASGVEYKDFVTVMGLISPSFGSAAEAGTSYKNFLSRLIPSTKSATAWMVDLGLATEDGTSKFYDSNGAFIGNAAAAQLLNEKMSGLSDASRAEAMSIIFGNDAKGAAIALMDAGAKGYDAFAQKMNEANGVQQQAAAVQQGFNFQMENMKGSLEALQITIGTALLPVLSSLIADYITPGINKVMEFTESFLNGGQATSMLGQATQALSDIWTGTLYPAIQTVIAYFQTTIMPILTDLAMALLPLVGSAIQILRGAWLDILLPALQMIWQMLSTVIIPIIAVLAGWLRDNLPGAVQWIADNLTDVFFPALHDIYDFISANVIPILAVVAQWLIQNVPVAVQATADFWNNVLWPALQKVWAFIQDSVIPIIEQVAGAVFSNLNAKTTEVSNFWTGVLQPALNKVWTFISNYVIPLFTALVNVHLAVLSKAVELLAAIWNNVLWPALEKVWSFIDKNIIPIFTALVNVHVAAVKKSFGDLSLFWTGTVVPAMEKLYGFIYDKLAPTMATLNSNVLQPMARWFENISSAVSDLIGWLNDLAKKIASIKIPDWAEGHSPPPLAEWFGYIADSVAAVNAQLPTLQMNLAQPIGAAGAAGMSTTTNSRSFTYAPTINSSGHVSAPMDLALATSLAGV